jgi:hypothetical protein
MKQCYILLKPDGLMYITCPYYTHKSAWGDPTHVRAISEDSFIYYSRSTIGSDGRPVVTDIDLGIVEGTILLDPKTKEREGISATLKAYKPIRTLEEARKKKE